MNPKVAAEYIGIFTVTSIVAGFIAVNLFNHLYRSSVASDVAFVDEDISMTSEVQESPKDLVMIDMYLQHIASINDPNQGCGCPSCCAAS